MRPVTYLVCFLFASAGPTLFAGAITWDQVVLVGTALPADNSVWRLVPNNDPGTELPPAGAVWYGSPFSVAGGFSTTFEFRLWDATGIAGVDGRAGGDGFAFVIQNSAAQERAIGLGASGLGYMYIPNSLAIEFDTFQNGGDYDDPNSNHIAVNTMGTGANMPQHTCAVDHSGDTPASFPCEPGPTLGIQANLSVDLRDGAKHRGAITYEQNLLSVYLNGSSTPEITVPVNLASTLQLGAGGTAWVGFTAGSRNSYQNTDISEWGLTTVPEPDARGMVLACIAALALPRAVRRLRRSS